MGSKGYQDQTLHDLNLYIVRETKPEYTDEGAILVFYDDISSKVWFPKSQVEFVVDEEGDKLAGCPPCEVTAPEWLLIDNGVESWVD